MANGQLNGTDLKVYVAGTLVAYSTNCSININHSLRSTSNKESGGWDENMEGMRNWDLSCDSLYAWLAPDGSAISGLTMSELLVGLFKPLTSAISESRVLSTFRVSLMLIACIFSMITFVKSFIAARKNR